MSDTLADLSSQFHHHHHNHHHMDTNNHHKTPFLFPSDFPYEFASSSSNESESDDDDISALTRRFTRSFSLQDRHQIPYPNHPLQKKRVFSGSPESTLNWPVSSPATPFLQPEDDPWDLIYAAAAGQVARMKMEMEMNMKMNNNLNDDVFTNTRPLLVPPPPPRAVNIGPPLNHHHHHHPNCTVWRSGNEEFIKQQQFRYRVAGAGSYGVAGRCGGGGRPVGFRQPAWPPIPVENQRRQQQPSNGFVAKPVLVGSGGGGGGGGGGGRVTAGLKRECAGTGVFLPGDTLTNHRNLRKNQTTALIHNFNLTLLMLMIINNYPSLFINIIFEAACSPAHLPARVVQSLNKGMDPILPNIYGHTHSDYGTAIGGGRKAVAIGRRSGVESAEVVLPQEWTY
ncbi:hypothetical protein OSB04_028295 [Centaurea solstitialis]|uniref:Uncharacterized protein n=1 Tax=Centaurea solstitialis TaxID=347529 RepID=A0AA38W938_9ASTR|nr:hypothetical protein OSB04_028295 [Centaurea solstitialis]